jgi:hypothetical protein
MVRWRAVERGARIGEEEMTIRVESRNRTGSLGQQHYLLPWTLTWFVCRVREDNDNICVCMHCLCG